MHVRRPAASIGTVPTHAPGERMSTDAEMPDLLFPLADLLARARTHYAPDVRWTAPRRALELVGRDAVVAHLAAEAAAMTAPQLVPLRRTVTGPRVVEESVIRFVYVGHGITGLDAAAGTRVELGRVRLLDTRDGVVVREACIEQWSSLGADGSSAPVAMAPHGRFAAGG
jgi:hypothetical protein